MPDELYLDDDLETDHPGFRIFLSSPSFVEKRTRGSVDFGGYDSKAGNSTYPGQYDSFDPSENYEVFTNFYMNIVFFLISTSTSMLSLGTPWLFSSPPE